MEKKKGKLALGIFFLLLGFVISYLCTPIYINALNGNSQKLNLEIYKINNFTELLKQKEMNFWIFILFGVIVFCGFLIVNFSTSSIKYKSDMMQITDNIMIPKAEGQKQCGSAKFMTEKEKNKTFKKVKLNSKGLEKLIQQGFLDKKPIKKYIAFKDRNKEIILFYQEKIDNNTKEIFELKQEIKKIDSYIRELESNKQDAEKYRITKKELEEKTKKIQEINKQSEKMIIESKKSIENYKIKIDETVIKLETIPVYGIPIEMISKTKNMIGIHKKTIEEIKVITGDVHSLIIGATRSGKSRTIVIQNICINAIKGINMLLSDPKGELYQYTYPMLKRLGYNVISIDFKDPLLSDKYNFLQFVIDKIEQGDIPKAISYCWDIVDSFVKESNNDSPIWSNGEKAILASAIMMVVYDNSKMGLQKIYPNLTKEEIEKLYETKHKYYQNMCNVYNFVSKMSHKGDDGKTLILTDFIENIPNDHPSKLILATAESAAEETRGSFITSALATLRLFTDPNIANMTNETKTGMFDVNKKIAIFMILPDEKETYYPLASMLTNQFYQYLVDVADKRGGRLPINFEFILDEFGNFVAIPGFANKMTVGAGRGIHFQLYVQSIEQLTQRYDKEIAGIIVSNCHYTIYLKTYGPETMETISRRLGKYTVLTPSNSTSSGSGENSGSESSSMSYAARELLFPEEVGKINRPYILVITDKNEPVITKSPDLSKWIFNDVLGLGDEKHNEAVRELRQKARTKNKLQDMSIILWDFKEHLRIIKQINKRNRVR